MRAAFTLDRPQQLHDYTSYVSRHVYGLDMSIDNMSEDMLIEANNVGAGGFTIIEPKIFGDMKCMSERTWRHIRRDNTKVFMFWFPLSGGFKLVRNGGSEFIDSDHYTVTCSDLPYRGESILNGSFEQHLLLVTAPYQFVTDYMPRAKEFVGKKIALDSDTSMAREILKGLAARLDVLSEGAAQQFMAPALHAALSGLDPRAHYADPGRSQQEGRIAELLSYIDRHLFDMDLTASKIAAGCSMSTRYVHTLLQRHGTNLTEYVWHSRYRQARDRIVDPRFAHETIGSIALSMGFRSNAHFSTGFRAIFGYSPSDARKRALMSADTTH